MITLSDDDAKQIKHILDTASNLFTLRKNYISTPMYRKCDDDDYFVHPDLYFNFQLGSKSAYIKRKGDKYLIETFGFSFYIDKGHLTIDDTSSSLVKQLQDTFDDFDNARDRFYLIIRKLTELHYELF